MPVRAFIAYAFGEGTSTMGRSRTYTLGAAGALVGALAACGGSDVTEFGLDGVGGLDAPAAAELGPVRAALSVDDGDAVVTLRNDTSHDASVALQLSVDSPVVHAVNDLGAVQVPAGSELREVFSRDRLDGFDVEGSEWLRAELRYGFELDSGVRGLNLTALAAREGVVIPAAEAIQGGYQMADSVLEGGIDLQNKATTFRVCFTNALSFKAVAGFINDNLSPNLSADGNFPAQNQHFYAYYPANSTTLIKSADLDAAGCTPPIERIGAGTQNWKFTVVVFAAHAQDTIYAVNSAGSTPSLNKTVAIPAASNPAIVSLAYPAGEDQQLNAANYLALNTLRRVSTLGVNPPGNNLLRVSLNTESTERSLFCDDANPPECPTAMTLRMGANNAANRGTVSHEVGHWIHETYAPTVALNYQYSQANIDTLDPGGTDLSTGCTARRTTGTGAHSFTSIEWMSSAHKEGLASFFQAVTYNSTAQKSCTVYSGTVPSDCEASGKSYNQCREWFEIAAYTKTGNELDWTRMYWDYVTDYSGTNFHTYMLAEQSVSSWPLQDDHHGLITSKLSGTQRTNFVDASVGNIMDGTPTRSSP